DVHGHDVRRHGSDTAARHPPGPALDHDESRELEAVHRDERRWSHPLERQLRRPLWRVHAGPSPPGHPPPPLPPPPAPVPRRAVCTIVLSRIPEVLQSINKGLNTLHFYEVTFNPNRPGELAGGAQDNGSWMREPGTNTWIETYVADGGYASFDAKDADYSTL